MLVWCALVSTWESDVVVFVFVLLATVLCLVFVLCVSDGLVHFSHLLPLQVGVFVLDTCGD